MQLRKSADEDDHAACTFQEMGVGAGTHVHIIVGSRANPVHCYTTVIGYLTDQYLIVQAPVSDGLPVLVHENEALTVQVFSGLEVFSFETTVLHVFRSPYFYLHLDFPSKVMRAPLRKAIRVKVGLAATVNVQGEAEPVAVQLVDLSVNGALIESSRRLGEAGDSVGLGFSFVAQPGAVDVRLDTQAKIRSVKKRRGTSKTADAFVAGVEFEALSPERQIMLQNLIYRTLLDDRKNMA